MNKGGRPRIYPFDKLEVGESFYIPLKDWNHRHSVAVAACVHARRHGGRFKTITDDRGILKVTRVA